MRKNEINFKSRLEKKVTAINEWKWNTNGKKSKQSWHQRAPEDVHSMQHKFNLIEMLELWRAFALPEVRVTPLFRTQVHLYPVYLLWLSLSWISLHRRYIYFHKGW